MVEKLYEEMIDVHNEMQRFFAGTLDAVSFYREGQEVERAYKELKRAIILLKNAQEDLANAMKKAYGIQL